MKITRLTKNALENVIKGDTRQQFKCIIKFYSNQCQYCHNLKSDYQKLAETFGDNVHFFAFNTSEVSDLDNLIEINGVPTIAFVDVNKRAPRISILQDPKEPHNDTWYYRADIERFIEDNIK